MTNGKPMLKRAKTVILMLGLLCLLFSGCKPTANEKNDDAGSATTTQTSQDVNDRLPESEEEHQEEAGNKSDEGSSITMDKAPNQEETSQNENSGGTDIEPEAKPEETPKNEISDGIILPDDEW